MENRAGKRVTMLCSARGPPVDAARQQMAASRAKPLIPGGRLEAAARALPGDVGHGRRLYLDQQFFRDIPHGFRRHRHRLRDEIHRPEFERG